MHQSSAVGAVIRVVAVLAYLLAPAGAANAQDIWTHCYTPTSGSAACYQTLEEAEAAMRADHVVGDLLVQERVTSSGTAANPYLRTYYRVPDQPPAYYMEPHYQVAGHVHCDARSPTNPDRCANEMDAIEGFYNFMKNGTSCTTTPYTLVGDYDAPYHKLGNPSGARSAHVSYMSTYSGHGRRVEWDSICSNGTHRRVYYVVKEGRVVCPAVGDWLAQDGYLPGHEPSGTTDTIAESQICRFRGSKPNITSKVRQVACPSGNCNPMYPGTGDKARFETDLVFAGRKFVRSYHSLLAGPQSTMAPGWRHSYSDVQIGSNPRRILRDDGYIDHFELVSSGLYRSKSEPSRTLRVSGSLSYMTEPDGYTKVMQDGRVVRAYHPGQPQDAVTLAYDNDDRLVLITDARGRTLTLLYSEAGMLNALEASDGESVVYTYGNAGNLAEVLYADGSKRLYHYAEPGLATAAQRHLLTGITDENGNRYGSFGYESRGRAIMSQLHTGNSASPHAARTTMSYTGTNTVTLTRATGEVVNYTITGQTRRTQSLVDGHGTTSNTYDTLERLTKKVDVAGVITQFGYATTYMNSITEAVGTPEERRRLIERDSNQQVVSSTLQRKQGSSLVTDLVFKAPTSSEGRATSACVIDPDSANSAYICGSQVDAPTGVRQSLFSYCSATDVAIEASTCPIVGMLKSVDGPRTDIADTTTFIYYAADDLTGCETDGPCHRKGDLHVVTDATGLVTTYARYDRAGRPLQIRDANGVATDLEYNDRGWLTARTIRGADEGSEADDAVTEIDYDHVGQVVAITAPDGSSISFDYDHAHRLTSITDSLDNSITYSLDDAGNRFQEETRDAAGVLRRSLSRLHNQLGELATVADAMATPTDFTYDLQGNLDTVTDALGRTSDNDYDALGRLRQSIANVGGAGPERAQTGFDYDTRDNLVQVTDPNGLATTYGYSGLNDLVQLVSPDTGTTTYGYDSAGNRTSQLDARGVEAHYSYDALNRLTGIDLPTAGQDIGFSYDSVPTECLAAESFGVGRLSGMTDPSGQTRYCYDHRGNVVRKSQDITAGPSRTVAYAFTAADRLASVTYPSGNKATYQRDAMGRITGISVKVTTVATPFDVVTGATYLPFGPLNQLTFGNGRVLTKTYDQNYGIDAISDNAVNGLSIDYGLDDVGNVVVLNEALGSTGTASRGVDYDGLDRLAALSDGASLVQGFGYDATGNRTSKTAAATEAYQYEADTHHLIQAGAEVRELDAAGNTTRIGSKYFTYDDRGRMSQLLSGSNVTHTYHYNARGERVAKVNVGSNSYSAYFVYDEAGHLLSEYKTNGNAIREFVWLDDTLVAVIDGFQGSRVQYVLTDHLGTPRAAVHPDTNAIIWRWDLTGSAFGEHAAQNDPDGDGAAYAINLRYPGQYFDHETGLHYNYFRDYDPGTGRYIQSDPIGLGGGMSTYAYVGSVPFGFSDPLGLDRDCGPGFRSEPIVGNSSARRCVPNPNESRDTKICITGDCAAFPPEMNTGCFRLCVSRELGAMAVRGALITGSVVAAARFGTPGVGLRVALLAEAYRKGPYSKALPVVQFAGIYAKCQSQCRETEGCKL